MSLPNVSRAVFRFEQSVILQTVARIQDDNGEDITTSTNTPIRAVIEIARPEELLIDNIDLSVEYLKVYARFSFDISDTILNENITYFIIYKNRSYKIIQVSDWIDYGYSRCFCAENKKDVNL